MVNYLDSRRIMGTTAERSSIPITAVTGGWVELGRTTLGGANSTIDVTSFADKRYYMVLASTTGRTGSSSAAVTRTGSSGTIDTSGNYAWRNSNNGGADATGTSSTSATSLSGNAEPYFLVDYIANYSSKEKLGIMQFCDQAGTGATVAPSRKEHVWKHVQTSNPLDSYRYYTGSSDTFSSGSEVVVLGYDPTDTHTTNFWEELADVTLSSAGDTISSGTFTAKKYLWVQCYTHATGGNITTQMRVGNTTVDSGSNYNFRYSDDGAADGSITSQTQTVLTSGDNTMDRFVNIFIINNASNEKLMISHSVNSNTAGAGNAPLRTERVHKWANTSNQINIIDIINGGAGNFDTGSFIKVWGSD